MGNVDRGPHPATSAEHHNFLFRPLLPPLLSLISRPRSQEPDHFIQASLTPSSLCTVLPFLL